MTKRKIINEGGIIGSQNSSIDIESKEFKMLKEVILEYSREQLPEQKTENEYLSIKFKIDTYLSSLNPKKVITVGEILKELMNLYKIKNKVFADYIGLSESNLSAVISGRRSINNDLALKFGNIFNIAPELWFKHSK